MRHRRAFAQQPLVAGTEAVDTGHWHEQVAADGNRGVLRRALLIARREIAEGEPEAAAGREPLEGVRRAHAPAGAPADSRGVAEHEARRDAAELGHRLEALAYAFGRFAPEASGRRRVREGERRHEAARLGPGGALLPARGGALGEDGARRAFGAVPTDNGSELADEDAIAEPIGEREVETRLFCCDPGQSRQKGAYEKNRVEIRKLLPEGAGARFDGLAAGCALTMSQVKSGPRGALGFLTPARVLRMALGEDSSALMDAFGWRS